MFFFGLLFVAVSCAALQQKVRSPKFEKAIELARGGETSKVRGILETACAEGTAPACQLLGKASPSEFPRIPIHQGVTTAGMTSVTYMEPKSALRHLLWEEDTLKLFVPSAEKASLIDDSEKQLLTQSYQGLSAGKKYWVQVIDDGDNLVDLRELRTLDLTRAKVKFGIASCMDDNFSSEQKGMWEDVIAQAPDVLFFIGDNVYADRPKSPADRLLLFRRYKQTRELLEIFRTPKLIPIIAVWDDHDYGKNDGNRTNPYKNDSLDVFNAFFPQETLGPAFERGPGVSSSFVGFRQRFVLTDGRSFRSSPQEGNVQTHWGAKQEEWLNALLKKGDTPVWLFGGDQFFGAYHPFESYQGHHPQSFEAMLKRLKKQSQPVVFVSGDRHLAELMKIEKAALGYETYELTTSGIHAKTYEDQWKKNPNKRQVDGVAGSLNYMMVESEAFIKGLKFKVTAYGPGKKELFSKSLVVKK